MDDAIEKPIVCPRCGEQQLGLGHIEPYRQSGNYHYRVLRSAARSAFSNARRLIVVGYSFPAYDLDIRAMLSSLGKDVELLVVDPAPSDSTLAYLATMKAMVQIKRHTFEQWLSTIELNEAIRQPLQ